MRRRSVPPNSSRPQPRLPSARATPVITSRKLPGAWSTRTLTGSGSADEATEDCGAGAKRLRRLLTHFARTAPPDQGYCQGLNFLGSTLLRVFDADRDPRATTVDARAALAFRGLVALVGAAATLLPRHLLDACNWTRHPDVQRAFSTDECYRLLDAAVQAAPKAARRAGTTGLGASARGARVDEGSDGHGATRRLERAAGLSAGQMGAGEVRGESRRRRGSPLRMCTLV